jgi:hypothetical protein
VVGCRLKFLIFIGQLRKGLPLFFLQFLRRQNSYAKGNHRF